MATKKATSKYLLTLDTDSTYSSGSKSNAKVGYRESDGKDIIDATRVGVFIADTSEFPTKDALKYKSSIRFVLGSPVGSGTYDHSAGATYYASVYGSNKDASTLAGYSYSKIIENSTLVSENTTISYGVDLVFNGYNAYPNHYKSYILVTKSKNKSTGDIYKDETKSFVEYANVTPTLSFQSYASEIYREKSFKIGWNYSCKNDRNVNIPQSKYTLSWVASNGTKGSVSGTTGSTYTFPSDTFPSNTTVVFTIKVTSSDGITATATSSNIAINKSVPTVSGTEPIESEQFYRAMDKTFKWSYSDAAGLPQTKYQIVYTIGGQSYTINSTSSNGSAKSHTIKAYTIPSAGTLTWKVKVWNSAGTASSFSPTYTAKPKDYRSKATFSDFVTSTYVAQSYKVAWTYEDELSVPQANWTLSWVHSNGTTGSKSGTTGKSTTFASRTFAVGTVQFTLTVKNRDGVVASTTSSRVTISNSKPVITVSSPIDGEQFYRANSETFKWNYSEPCNLAQRYYQITYTQGGVQKTTGKIESANKYHTFGSRAFSVGTISYTLTVWNSDGTSTTSQVYTANAINSVPTIKASSPVGSANFNHYDALEISWSYSDTANVSQKTVKIDYTSGGQSKSVTVNTQEASYKFPSSTFSEGILTYYLTAYNYDGVASAKAGPYTANCVMSIPSVKVTYPANVEVNYSSAFEITWDFTESYTTGQKSWIVDITNNGSTRRYSGNNSNTSLSIPARTFFAGSTSFVVTVTNNDNKTATSARATFDIVPSIPKVDVIYPNGVLVRKTEEVTFTWNYEEDVPVGQTEYWIYINDTQYAHQISANHYHTFETNTLPDGNCEWKLKVKNADSQIVEVGSYSFTVVSESSAPSVQSVTNDAKPTITWIAESQDGFEIDIFKDDNTLLHQSDLVIDKTSRSYQIDTILVKGKYFVQMRVVNEYGYYTPYGSKYFEITADCESEIENAYIYINAELGVELRATFTGGEAYVIRKFTDSDDIELLGKYDENGVDWTIPANTICQYAIRLYDKGIVDSAWRNAKITTSEVVLRELDNPKNFIELWKSQNQQFDILKTDAKEKSLMKCLGRTYPVLEVGEWIDSTRIFSAYVSDAEYNQIVKMSLSGSAIGLQTDGEYMVVSIEITDEGKTMEGRNIKVLCTRIEDE